MKKKILLASVASLLLAGCGDKNWDATVNSSFLRVDKVSSGAWISGADGDVGASIEIKYERPVDSCLAEFIDRQIAKSYMDATGVEVHSPGMDAVKEIFVQQYESSGKEEDWQFKGFGSFYWFNSVFASYRTTFVTYFGGLHPNQWHGNATYDRRTGRRITLADLFDETNIVAVVNLIRKAIAADETRSDYLREKCSNDVSGVAADFLGKCEGGDPKVTENFMVVEDGLAWTYNEYEISSYGEGTTDVVIPWDDIGDYLREFAPTPITIPVGGWDAALEAARKNGDFERVGDMIFFKK